MSQTQSCEPLAWEKPAATYEYILKQGQKVIDFNLILTGLAEDIEYVLQNTPDLPITPSPIHRIVLSEYIHADLLAQVPELSLFRPMQIHLYEFSPDEESEQKVWEAVARIYQQAAQDGRIVFADPNYITGDPEGGSGGSGNVLGGPEGGSGSSGNVLGGPEGGSGSSGHVLGGANGNLNGQQPDDAYRKHWSFHSDNGIGLETGVGIRINNQNKGQHADVYIFDTVDKRIHQDVNLIEDGTNRPRIRNFVSFQRAHPSEPLEICISSPAERFLGTSHRHIQIKSAETRTIDEHGLFVAGVIHRIAPKAKLHLVDVLNQHGQGELFGFLNALMLLAKRGLGKLTPATPQPLHKSIVNMSLGVTLSKGNMAQAGVQQALKAMRTAHIVHPTTNNFLLRSILEDMVNNQHYVGSLRTITKLLSELGTILVAAAGNDSATITGDLPPQIPARYDEVISVAASVYNGKRANYSNRGDVTAPGGGTDLPDVKPQHPPTSATAAKDMTPFTIMSVAPQLKGEDAGFAIWSGTSFAAPMVSGILSLLVEKMTINNVSLTTTDLKELLANRARNGIVDVQMALDAIEDK